MLGLPLMIGGGFDILMSSKDYRVTFCDVRAFCRDEVWPRSVGTVQIGRTVLDDVRQARCCGALCHYKRALDLVREQVWNCYTSRDEVGDSRR